MQEQCKYPLTVGLSVPLPARESHLNLLLPRALCETASAPVAVPPLRHHHAMARGSGTRKVTVAQKAATAKKEKEVASAANLDSCDKKWAKSICEKEDLERLVRWGALPDQVTTNWCATNGFAFPTLDTKQLVLFYHHVSWGLGVPVQHFVRNLLDYWGIKLIHLSRNAILHLSIFIHRCEAFRGSIPISISLFPCLLLSSPPPLIAQRPLVPVSCVCGIRANIWRSRSAAQSRIGRKNGF